MHLHLPGPGTAAHADILQGAAHAGLLVAFEVGQADKHIRVHNGPADLGLLHVLAALHRDGHLIVALQPVSDEDMAAGGVGGKSVHIGRLNVIQGVFPPADIQGVAVRQEGLAALVLHQIRHHLGPVGPQVGQVPRLTEVQLDGHVFVLQIHVPEPGGHHQPGQFLGQVLPVAGAAEISEIDFGFLRHVGSPFPYFISGPRPAFPALGIRIRAG